VLRAWPTLTASWCAELSRTNPKSVGYAAALLRRSTHAQLPAGTPAASARPACSAVRWSAAILYCLNRTMYTPSSVARLCHAAPPVLPTGSRPAAAGAEVVLLGVGRRPALPRCACTAVEVAGTKVAGRLLLDSLNDHATSALAHSAQIPPLKLNRQEQRVPHLSCRRCRWQPRAGWREGQLAAPGWQPPRPAPAQWLKPLLSCPA
jgi:hypothetical protein